MVQVLPNSITRSKQRTLVPWQTPPGPSGIWGGQRPPNPSDPRGTVGFGGHVYDPPFDTPGVNPGGFLTPGMGVDPIGGGYSPPRDTYPPGSTSTADEPTQVPPKKDDGNGDNPPKGPPPKYDPYEDPFVKDLIAKRDVRLAGVRGQAREKQKTMLLGFGSKEMARAILGGVKNPMTGQLYEEEPWFSTISDDPNTGTSWLARSFNTYNRNKLDYNEQSNAQNLWYGGGRTSGLERLAREQTLSVADQANATSAALSGAWDPVISAEMDWQQMIDDAAAAAYARYINSQSTGT